MPDFDIFISYRRKGGYDTAKLIYDRLRLDGYSVSFDIDTLRNGNFDIELEHRVSDCKDFLLVLSPGIFDRFSNADYDPKDDWVRREIACALLSQKNIVPLTLEGFTFPKSLPDDIKDIVKKNAVEIYPKYFEAAYSQVKLYLISKAHWRVRHKRKIIAAASAMFLLIALFFVDLLSQTSLELEETKIIAEEMGSVLDSIQQERERRQEMRKQERTIHWSDGQDDSIGNLIFEKIKEAGVQRTACSGRGLIVTPNKANCREDAKDKKAMKYTCFYSPRITFTTCDSRPYTFFEKDKRFRSSPAASEELAREEILNELRNADFSDWVSDLKGLKRGSE